MAEHGVVCSMSRSGNVWDNAAMESFFALPSRAEDPHAYPGRVPRTGQPGWASPEADAI
jgi:transposase InsO family protein